MDFQRMWGRPSAQSRIAAWFNGTKFDPKKLRGVLMGIAITTTLGEISCYRLIKQDIKAGELPYYLADLLIVIFSVFEAIVAPLVSWWGFTKRRTLLIGYTTASIVFSLSWFFMPGKVERKESELCDADNSNNDIGYHGTTARSIIRLVMVLLSCGTFIVTRVACWSHGMAYSDEYAPARTSVHYGVVILARMIPLVLGHKMFTGAVEDNMTLQCVGLVFGFLVNWIQLFFIVPRTAPVVKGEQRMAMPLHERSLFLSIGRVFYNSVAMTQIFAMGLTAAALWGYGYYEIDIIKVKFHLIPETQAAIHLSELFFYHFVVVVTAYVGVKFSAPVLMEFCNLKAVKLVIITNIFILIIYVTLTTVPGCDTGNVAGLGKSYYGHPECSLPCNCKPQWEEFKPVCAVDDMVTYVSPCHAGCSDSQEINGVQVYANCSCAGGGRVLERACGDAECRRGWRFHSTLFTMLVTFAIFAFQAQGVVLLRAVDPRDKAVVMGVAWSIVAIMTFVVGQLIFYGLQVATCGWFEGGKCHLQSEVYPYIVGATCAFLTLTSIMTSVTSWICVKMANKNKNDGIETRL